MPLEKLAGVATGLRARIGVLAICCLGAAPGAMAGDAQTWDNVSTGLVLGLGGAAVAATWSHSDNEGLKQGLKTAGATLLAVEVLKVLVQEERPDGSDNKSFPSGHTALAFAAATYFDKRYGHEYRQYVPVMYGLAALTGVARVQADKHYVQDVLAGAAIGWGLAHAFTTPYNSQFIVAPTGDGLMFSYTKHF